jgi:hypothetical protein
MNLVGLWWEGGIYGMDGWMDGWGEGGDRGWIINRSLL